MPPHFLSPSLYTPFLITMMTLDRSARQLYDDAFELDALATDAAKHPARRHFAEIEGIAESEFVDEKDRPEYALLGNMALGEYVRAVENESQLCAAAVILVANDTLQDLAGRIELPTELRLDYGVRVGDVSFTKVLCAAGNNFRHWRAWANFERDHGAHIHEMDELLEGYDGIKQMDSDELQYAKKQGFPRRLLEKRLQHLRSIRVLRGALRRGDSMGRVAAFDVLNALADQGVDTFNAFQAAAMDAGDAMVATRGQGAGKGFRVAKEWQRRYASALRADLRE